MDEQCLVLRETGCVEMEVNEILSFRSRMGRMVPVYEGIGCEELERNVLCEFRMDEARFGVTLSYWPPTSLELATGIRTPPVL
ncbi:unnamed protein product, partial [Brassica oleracea var. botrytis]